MEALRKVTRAAQQRHAGDVRQTEGDNRPVASLSATDVRELQLQLKAQGVVFQSEADENTTGPVSFVVVDPDGNPTLVDQHV